MRVDSTGFRRGPEGVRRQPTHLFHMAYVYQLVPYLGEREIKRNIIYRLPFPPTPHLEDTY